MKRRQFVKGASGIGLTAIAGLAGCTGSDSEVTASGNANDGNSGNSGENKQTSGGSTNSKSSGDSGSDSEKKLKLLNHEFYEKDYSAGVKGKVKNVSGSELGYVGVQVKFVDAEGTRIGESLDNTTELPAGSAWAFDAPTLGTKAEKIEDYKIEVGTTPFS